MNTLKNFRKKEKKLISSKIWYAATKESSKTYKEKGSILTRLEVNTEQAKASITLKNHKVTFNFKRTYMYQIFLGNLPSSNST